jgi:hypothetical protein
LSACGDDPAYPDGESSTSRIGAENTVSNVVAAGASVAWAIAYPRSNEHENKLILPPNRSSFDAAGPIARSGSYVSRYFLKGSPGRLGHTKHLEHTQRPNETPSFINRFKVLKSHLNAFAFISALTPGNTRSMISDFFVEFRQTRLITKESHAVRSAIAAL